MLMSLVCSQIQDRRLFFLLESSLSRGGLRVASRAALQDDEKVVGADSRGSSMPVTCAACSLW